MLDPRKIAEEHIEQAARELDLTTADDRVTFRARLFDGYHMTRVRFIIEQARSLGAELPGNASRDKAERAVANAHLTRVNAGQVA
jgi:hypothetical protein